MQCPVCKTTNLVMAERQGIEIDYCQQCRGVWLDRGELDKIIERSTETAAAPVAQQQAPAPQPAPQPQAAPYPPQYPPQYPQQQHPQHGHYDPRYGYKKKRKGFLSDLFDFD